MAFVIQPVVRQGGVRPSYRVVLGSADNAAGGRLGADAAVVGFRDTALVGIMLA
jgi:hypothetical protein